MGRAELPTPAVPQSVLSGVIKASCELKASQLLGKAAQGVFPQKEGKLPGTVLKNGALVLPRVSQVAEGFVLPSIVSNSVCPI